MATDTRVQVLLTEVQRKNLLTLLNRAQLNGLAEAQEALAIAVIIQQAKPLEVPVQNDAKTEN